MLILLALYTKKVSALLIPRMRHGRERKYNGKNWTPKIKINCCF